MILPDGHLRPRIDPSARIAPNAVVSGDVEIGPNTSVGFGAVIVAESGPVRIAGQTVIMDNAVLRGVRGCPLHIGAQVLIGPRAVLTGCVIEDEAFVATGATIFNGAIVGARAEVRINAIVHLRTRLADEAMVPLGWIAVGDPAQILPPERHDDIWAVQKELDFPSFVFGVERPSEGESIMRDVMPRYSAMLARRHLGDAAVVAIASSREDILFDEVDYSSEVATKCLDAFAAELSRRLGVTFDLKKSGDPELPQMQHPHGTFVVARLGDMPLGCVGIKGNGGPLAEVKRMWIAPAARGLGLGRRLMTKAEDAARALSIATLRLDTNSALFEAVSLYQRMGWSEIGRFNDDPYPDIFMEKQL